MSTKEELIKAGIEVRNDMFGAAETKQAIESATSYTRPLQDIVNEYCFGDIWNRPHLDRKARSMLTIAILTALGKSNQLKIHVKGAIANGVSTEEIREIILHTMLYAGIPAAVDGFVYSSEVLNEIVKTE